jgi:hypothetical protein
VAKDDDAGPAGETPIQRALRLKKAAQAARAAPGGGRKGDAERAAAARSSAKSKPWMKK